MCPRRDCALPGALPKNARAALLQPVSRVTKGFGRLQQIPDMPAATLGITSPHTWRDFTSILRLIEVRFNASSLTARDAAADDMMDFFDFSSPHWLTPPTLPVQPTTGTCDKTKEKPPGF